MDFHLSKEFEASHGTVADLWQAHQRGEETSMNPLGLAEALLGAMNHSADLLIKKAGEEKDQSNSWFKEAATQVREVESDRET